MNTPTDSLTAPVHYDYDGTGLEQLLIPLGQALVGQTDAHGDLIVDDMGYNQGRSFRNDVFAIREYCWCDGEYHGLLDDPDFPDDPTTACPPNFEHFASGLKVEWYKHMRRGVMANQALTVAEMQVILKDCLESLVGPA